MLPKVIHYCWFGGNPLPELAKKCIASWKKYFPDYEIKEWNESNFDLNACAYVKEAYAAKKWAFVSDYARFWILYHHGGLYFDTDVEVVRSFDEILARGPLMGKEGEVKAQNTADIPCNAGLGLAAAPGLGLAAAPGLGLYGEILKYYETQHFIDQDGNINQETVVDKVTNLLKKYGYQGNNEVECIQGVYIYPPEYFCPKSYSTGKLTITSHTHSIHHYTASWFTSHEQRVLNFYQAVNSLFGVRIGEMISKPVHWEEGLRSRVQKYGWERTMQIYKEKVIASIRGGTKRS